MSKRPAIIYNRYFLIPLLIWIISGGALLLLFDRRQLFEPINSHYNTVVDWLMYYITWIGEGVVITVIYLILLFTEKSLRNWWYFFAALFSSGLSSILSQLLKRVYHEPRPMSYFHKATWVHFSPNWGEILMRDSFPSGHTTGAFSMFCLLSMLLPYKYRYFGIWFFLLALLVGYSRMYLAAHFFADVYTGSILGSFTSLVTIYILDRIKPLKKGELSTR